MGVQGDATHSNILLVGTFAKISSACQCCLLTKLKESPICMQIGLKQNLFLGKLGLYTYQQFSLASLLRTTL